jgi:hypothetical protein
MSSKKLLRALDTSFAWIIFNSPGTQTVPTNSRAFELAIRVIVLVTFQADSQAEDRREMVALLPAATDRALSREGKGAQLLPVNRLVLGVQFT